MTLTQLTEEMFKTIIEDTACWHSMLKTCATIENCTYRHKSQNNNTLYNIFLIKEKNTAVVDCNLQKNNVTKTPYVLPNNIIS